MSDPNKTPEQIARDRIDQMLHDAGWSVQDKNQIDFGKAHGIAVREYPTDSGPADYVLFAYRKPIVNRTGRDRYETTYDAQNKWRQMMEDRWLSVDEIATYLGIKRDTVYKWISERQMPGHKIGRLWKFQKDEVDEWVKKGNAKDPDSDKKR